MSKRKLRQLPPGRATQRGAVLFVSLILLFILTLIGITAARMQASEEIMARNENNHQLAMQAAEAALRSGETLSNLHDTADYAVNNYGLYDLAMETQGGTQKSVADMSNSAWTAALGGAAITYNGPALSNVPTSPQAAEVIIENLPPAATSMICTANYPPADCSVIRVTAHAEGADGTASSTVQSIYRMPKP